MTKIFENNKKRNMMKRNQVKKYLGWALPVLVLAAGIIVSSIIRNSRPEAAIVVPEKKLATIRGIIARKTSFQPVIHAQGTVKAKQQIDLVPEVAGKIIWVASSFADGGMFKAGDALIRIDPRNYQFAVARARASVADAENSLALEQAEAGLARSEWEELGTGKKASSLVLREPQMAKARAKLSSARADLDRALLDLERTTVKAPFNGRVEKKNVDIGQYVTLGTNLAQLYSTDIAEISLPLTERELGEVDMSPLYGGGASGMEDLKVFLHANVGGKRRNWIGTLVRTAGSVDINSRVLSVIVEVRNPYQVTPGGAPLLNGLFVEAEIPGKKIDDVFLLPRSALRNQDEVVIVDKNDELRTRKVEVVHSTPDEIVVRGLKEGERVNISPLEVLVVGTKVKWQLDSGADGESKP